LTLLANTDAPTAGAFSTAASGFGVRVCEGVRTCVEVVGFEADGTEFVLAVSFAVDGAVPDTSGALFTVIVTVIGGAAPDPGFAAPCADVICADSVTVCAVVLFAVMGVVGGAALGKDLVTTRNVAFAAGLVALFDAACSVRNRGIEVACNLRCNCPVSVSPASTFPDFLRPDIILRFTYSEAESISFFPCITKRIVLTRFSFISRVTLRKEELEISSKLSTIRSPYASSMPCSGYIPSPPLPNISLIVAMPSRYLRLTFRWLFTSELAGSLSAARSCDFGRNSALFCFSSLCLSRNFWMKKLHARNASITLTMACTTVIGKENLATLR